MAVWLKNGARSDEIEDIQNRLNPVLFLLCWNEIRRLVKRGMLCTEEQRRRSNSSCR